MCELRLSEATGSRDPPSIKPIRVRVIESGEVRIRLASREPLERAVMGTRSRRSKSFRYRCHDIASNVEVERVSFLEETRKQLVRHGLARRSRHWASLRLSGPHIALIHTEVVYTGRSRTPRDSVSGPLTVIDELATSWRPRGIEPYGQSKAAR
jgi:hypothetical protein